MGFIGQGDRYPSAFVLINGKEAFRMIAAVFIHGGDMKAGTKEGRQYYGRVEGLKKSETWNLKLDRYVFLTGELRRNCAVSPMMINTFEFLNLQRISELYCLYL